MLRTYSSKICDFSFMVRFLAKMERGTESLTGVVSFYQVSLVRIWVLFK
jgi:hypothetical protein